jgi:hypothetical protein
LKKPLTKAIKYVILIIENKRKEVNKMITLNFDMDGTIADLYGVKDWLPKLRAEDVTPYAIAKPLVDMQELAYLLNALKQTGDFRIVVISWGSLGGSAEYVRQAKKVKTEWLKQFNFPFDEIHCVKYGTPKQKFIPQDSELNILWDDNKEIRQNWNGIKNSVAFSPDNNGIIEFLQMALDLRIQFGAE